MYCYFSSAYPAAIKINGAFFGRIDGDAKGISIDDDSAFIEICPLDLGATSSFILDQNFLSEPPPAVSVVNLKGGYLIRFYKPPDNSGFKIVAQEKYSDAVVTVFSDNGLKASIETPQYLFSDDYGFNVENAEISRVNVSGKDVIAVHFSKIPALYLYDLTNGGKKLGVILARSFFTANGYLYTTLIKTDIAKHTIENAWEIKNGKIFESDRKVSASDGFDKTALPEILIPYAFFEELAVDGDYSFYLSEKIKENADKLKSYFGEFLSVMPPPAFRDEKEVGLIYKISENKYSVDYATVEISDGKIVNLKRSDF